MDSYTVKVPVSDQAMNQSFDIIAISESRITKDIGFFFFLFIVTIYTTKIINLQSPGTLNYGTWE